MRFTRILQAARFLKIFGRHESNQNWGRVNRDSERTTHFHSSCPGLTRLRGRSRFGEAKAQASTSFPARRTTWMAGTGPAMTAENG
jgi:hypothetical protein